MEKFVELSYLLELSSKNRMKKVYNIKVERFFDPNEFIVLNENYAYTVKARS